MAIVSNLKELYPETKDCKVLSKQIESITIKKAYYAQIGDKANTKAYDEYLVAKKKWYNQYGCELLISENKFQKVNDLVDQANKIAQDRIALETGKKTTTQKEIAVLVLVSGLFIVLLFKNK